MMKSKLPSAYIGRYTDYMELTNYSPSTVSAYSKSVVQFLNFVRDNTVSNKEYIEYCQSYLLSLRKNRRTWGTINIHYSALKLFCIHILSKEWEIEKLPRPKPEKKLVRILSKREISQVLTSPKSLKHRTMLYLFYATGIRISELTNIKLGDIDSDRLELFVRQGKGKKDRIVDIPSCIIPVLRLYYKTFRPKEYLFEGASKRRRQYSHSSIHKILTRAKKKMKIEKAMSAHTLRHCYATHHLENGTDLVYIKEQLGHTDIATTEKYLHLCSEIKRQIHHPIEELQIDLLESII